MVSGNSPSSAKQIYSKAYNQTLDCGISDSLLKECKDFHQAKDGDGWVEQSSQPFFFGMLQQVGAPEFIRKRALLKKVLLFTFS